MMSRVLLLCLAIALPGWGRAEPSQEAFDQVLRAHVKDGHVDYPAIAGDKSFAAYIEQLGAPADPASKTDKLVYYMNAYNALAIKGILDGGSPSSFFSRQKYFKSTSYQLGGRSITLEELEHRMIRPLGDPRSHFSIVCASKSCPKLRSDAYTAARLDSQLDENARAFINDPSRNRFDKTGKVASLSEIFKWFDSDFEKSAGSVQKFLARYVADPEVAKDLESGKYTVKYLSYDWGLNGTPPKR